MKRLFKCLKSNNTFVIGKVYEYVNPNTIDTVILLAGEILLRNDKGFTQSAYSENFKELTPAQVYQRDYHKFYRQENRELLNNRSAEYAKAHRVELRQKSKEYRAANHEKLKEYEASRWPKRKEQRRLKRELLKQQKNEKV